MHYDEIFLTLKKTILEIMGTIDDSAITPQNSLRELGANSMDRADILMQVMSKLGLKIPMIEFASAKNIHDIVSIFYGAAHS